MSIKLFNVPLLKKKAWTTNKMPQQDLYLRCIIDLFAHTHKKIACQPSGTLGLKQTDDFKIYSLTQISSF